MMVVKDAYMQMLGNCNMVALDIAPFVLHHVS